MTADERAMLTRIHRALYGNDNENETGLLATVREIEAHLYGSRGGSGITTKLAEVNTRLKSLESAVGEFTTVVRTLRAVLAFFGLTTFSGILALVWWVSYLLRNGGPP